MQLLGLTSLWAERRGGVLPAGQTRPEQAPGGEQPAFCSVILQVGIVFSWWRTRCWGAKVQAVETMPLPSSVRPICLQGSKREETWGHLETRPLIPQMAVTTGLGWAQAWSRGLAPKHMGRLWLLLRAPEPGLGLEVEQPGSALQWGAGIPGTRCPCCMAGLLGSLGGFKAMLFFILQFILPGGKKNNEIRTILSDCSMPWAPLARSGCSWFGLELQPSEPVSLKISGKSVL